MLTMKMNSGNQVREEEKKVIQSSEDGLNLLLLS